MDRPIPAFYACYLLRSTVRHQSLYVGSTPNPVRRLRQHNGDAKGGAVRTSRDSLRPWEMTCLVTGFPSKIAALQFEWAWQNTHLTRHIAPDTRLTQAKSTVRFSPKSGRARKRVARPRMCLTDRLANLHLLLRASSFERWPLKVTFYAEDVYRVWVKWKGQQVEKLRPGIEVKLGDSSKVAGPSETDEPMDAKGIYALDVGYSGYKQRLEKSNKAFESADWLHCAICHKGLSSSGAMTLVCPNEDCSALTHIDCLSAAFLQAGSNHEAIVPTTGNCPGCSTKLEWVDLVKELSLRMRGEKEVTAIFKKRRRTKKQTETAVIDDANDESDEDEEMDDMMPDGDWHKLPESSDVEVDEAMITRSNPSPALKSKAFKRTAPATSYSEPVIEDSDWDEAEILI
ncbi:hypothetical protein LTR36_006895 [Oleoguttula mirabilis]|uniref:GIY-YIG domain-containing protein n=1 Tax=Oleoguttula mirabilis TaxID=1507867 RepID=A0AAV9JB59_9PEZI|nr:hypothetical protein LTR36_006895 [Oleoguttula mirabilis]